MDRDIKPDCNVQILYEDNHLIVAVKTRRVCCRRATEAMLLICSVYSKDYVRIKYNKPGGIYRACSPS